MNVGSFLAACALGFVAGVIARALELPPLLRTP